MGPIKSTNSSFWMNFKIINKGKIIKSDTKNNLLNLINKKNVSFVLEKKLNKIPKELNKYNIKIKNNILSMNYEKNKISLNNIIHDLHNSKITFKEINTSETNLEDVFIELTKEN